ncbi:hypothetical protein OROMI_027896 [Orobanche minor]
MSYYDHNFKEFDHRRRKVCYACGMNGNGANVFPYSYDYEQEPEQSYWVMGHNEEMPKWQDRRNDYWDDYRNNYPPNEYHPGLRNHPIFSWRNNNPMPYDANAQAQYNGGNRAQQTTQESII